MQTLGVAGGLAIGYLIWYRWGKNYLQQFRDMYRLYTLYKAAGGDLATSGIEKHPGFVIITYQDAGKSYRVCLPYNPQRAGRMCGLSVKLETSDGEKLDITQQPGIPYVVNPKDLAGTVSVISPLAGRSEYTDRAPMYLCDLDYDE